MPCDAKLTTVFNKFEPCAVAPKNKGNDNSPGNEGQALPPTICYDFQTDSCFYGDNCKHLHVKVTRDEFARMQKPPAKNRGRPPSLSEGRLRDLGRSLTPFEVGGDKKRGDGGEGDKGKGKSSKKGGKIIPQH